MSSSIAPQDPSTSPTYAMSTDRSQREATGSIRRNLFAGHLSRRPTATSSHNPFGPPSPTNDERSQPTLFSAAPSIQPSKRNPTFNDIYDPDASPPPPSQSSTLTTTALPRESIIALHPVTGRPLLPNIPTLPPRLRLSDEDGEDEEMSDMEDEQHHGNHNPGFTQSPSYHNGLNHLPTDFDLDQDLDLDSSELERFSTYHNPPSLSMRLNVHQFLDTTAEESRADGERIEVLLLEMASRQRARARTIPTPEPTSSTSLESGNAASRGFQASSTNQMTGTSVLSSSRRRAGAAGGPFASKQLRRDPSPQKGDGHSYSHAHLGSMGNDASMLPVGKAIDPLEKEELVSLIMTSLRRKVAIAEEEGWMYGDGDYVGIGTSAAGIDGEPFE